MPRMPDRVTDPDPEPERDDWRLQHESSAAYVARILAKMRQKLNPRHDREIDQ